MEFPYGRYCFFLSILGFKSLAQKIAQANATTRYVLFTPFYINEIVERQVEFDEDYMFYLECRNQFNEADEIAHWIIAWWRIVIACFSLISTNPQTILRLTSF